MRITVRPNRAALLPSPRRSEGGRRLEASQTRDVCSPGEGTVSRAAIAAVKTFRRRRRYYRARRPPVKPALMPQAGQKVNRVVTLLSAVSREGRKQTGLEVDLTRQSPSVRNGRLCAGPASRRGRACIKAKGRACRHAVTASD